MVRNLDRVKISDKLKASKDCMADILDLHPLCNL